MNTQLKHISLQEGKKIYFASDFHFGIPNEKASRERELLICNWLDYIKKDAQQIYLLGDLFDAWMEYKKVVPRGFTRFFGKIAELSDSGIEIIVFTGNHDLWMRDYFQKEFGIAVFHTVQTIKINDKTFHIGHGDGVGPGDKFYKLLKAFLRNPFCQFLYRQLHPDFGYRIAEYFSQKGDKHKYEDLQFLGEDKEYQVLYAKEMLQKEHIDYFIFGHRHILLDLELKGKSQFINLGDWISYNSYAHFDGSKLELSRYLKK